VNRHTAVDLLDELHRAQNAFYGGEDDDGALRDLLDPSVVWTVPGDNRIAGTYRGVAEVLTYFRRRRELAGGTFRMQRRDVLVGEGSRIAALTDGVATIGGQEHVWSTVGLYDVVDGRIAACWLLPLDPLAFDRIWSA
jgi:ketosteroid isomerase-like protein